MKLRFIDDIDRLWHFSETRIAAVALVLSAASPVLQLWDAVPDSVKLYLPDTLRSAMPLVIIFAFLIAARATTIKPAAPTKEAEDGHDSTQG